MAPIATAKKGFQNDQDLKNALTVVGPGFISQLFSIVINLNCFGDKDNKKKKIKSY
jgi:hypothetical protein